MREEEQNALENGVREALKKASPEFHQELEVQQRAWAKPFRLVGEINHQSKLVFDHLAKGDLESAHQVLMGARTTYGQLREVPLPEIHKAEKMNAGGEAFAKAALGIAFYPALIGDREPGEVQVPSKEDLNVTLAAWINGLAKFAGEIGKLTAQIAYRQIRRNKLPITDTEIYERRVAIAEGVQKFLDSFSSVHPVLLNINHNRENDYNSRRHGVSAAVVRGMEDVNNLSRGAMPDEIPQD